MSRPIQKISPFLWFDTQAEEAARFYTSIFPNSSVGLVNLKPVLPMKNLDIAACRRRRQA